MKRFGMFLLMAVVLGSFAFARASGDRSSAGTGADARVLNIAYSGTPQPAEKEYVIDVYVKNFESRYGVKVNVEFITQDDCVRKIESEQDTNNIISDVVYVDTSRMGAYVNNGWMEDISGMIHRGSTITKLYDDTTK
jgi:ABC-type glycerol-3-phosphate transport system substrate-binding protein